MKTSVGFLITETGSSKLKKTVMKWGGRGLVEDRKMENTRPNFWDLLTLCREG